MTGCGTSSSSGAAAPQRSSTPTAVPSSPSSTPSTPANQVLPSRLGTVTLVATVASGLDVPWGLSRLPDASVLVTTRDDYRVHRLDVANARITQVGSVPGVVSNVAQQGEAGLLGIAVSPDFTADRRIYFYYSTARDNRIGWATYGVSADKGRALGRMRTIVTGIPHGVHHNGGRLTFGPDKMLYASTGEAERAQLAQDKSSLGGKILRMTRAGRPAPGNPFGSLVWSYGHRNVQGLAFDDDDRLWASEFGDKTADELNLIRKGRNYGWPATQGRTSDPAYTGPVAQWGTDEDSPSGIAYAGGSIWMAALQGQRLWRIPLDGARTLAEPQGFLSGRYGRLRSVLALSDSDLLVTTSNRDGRQQPTSGDDRILLLRVT